jgi:hypothetical protein
LNHDIIVGIRPGFGLRHHIVSLIPILCDTFYLPTYLGSQVGLVRDWYYTLTKLKRKLFFFIRYLMCTHLQLDLPGDRGFAGQHLELHWLQQTWHGGIGNGLGWLHSLSR